MIPNAIFERLFQMPAMPDINLPLPGWIQRPAIQAINFGFGVAFKVGVEQGFLAGCIFTLIVIQGLALARSRKGD